MASTLNTVIAPVRILPPAMPSIRFLFIGSQLTFHASFPHSVALVQLRFTSFAVINLWRDLHPQECAHAGRTKKALPMGSACSIYVRVVPMSATDGVPQLNGLETSGTATLRSRHQCQPFRSAPYRA